MYKIKKMHLVEDYLELENRKISIWDQLMKNLA